MVYDLLLPLGGAFIIILLILLKKRGSERERNAHRRTTRGGLALERSPKEKRAAKQSSIAGPLILGLAIAIIGGWLAISYFAPSRAASSSEMPAPLPEARDSRVMSGRIVMGQDSAPQNNSPMAEAAAQAGAAGSVAARQEAPAAPAPPQPETTTLAQAAQGMLPPVSRMEQVGLLPARAGAHRPQAQKPPTAAPRPQVAPAPAPTPQAAPAPQQTAPRPAATAQPPADNRPILGGTREFTVHLASFADRANAEKYMGKLATARLKDIFITESVINGQLWFRVMSGRFANRAEADAHGQDLRRRNLTASGGRYVIKSVP